MKCLFVLLTILLSQHLNTAAYEYYGEVDRQSDLEARIQQLQNVNRDLTANGIKVHERLREQVKYIRLDEISLENVQVDVKRPTVRMEVNNLREAIVKSTDLSVSALKVDLLNSRIMMNFKAPEVIVQGSCSIGGYVKASTAVTAENPFTMKAKEIEISAAIKVVMGEEITVEDIKFSTFILKTQGQFGNIEGVDVVIKSAVSKAIAEDLIKAILPQIENNLKQKLVNSLQTSLSGVGHCSLVGCQLPVESHPKFVKEQTQNINALVDEALELVSDIMKNNGLDPVALPDIGINWGFSIFKLKLGFFDGLAEGISNLVRADDWTLHINGLTKYSVDGTVAVFNSAGQYTWIAKFMGVGAEADFRGDVSYLDITIDFSLDVLNCSISMDTFEIGDVGHIDVTVDGFYLFDWLFEIVTEFFTNLLVGVITNIVEYIVQDAINDIIEAFDICGQLFPAIVT